MRSFASLRMTHPANFFCHPEEHPPCHPEERATKDPFAAAGGCEHRPLRKVPRRAAGFWGGGRKSLYPVDSSQKPVRAICFFVHKDSCTLRNLCYNKGKLSIHFGNGSVSLHKIRAMPCAKSTKHNRVFPCKGVLGRHFCTGLREFFFVSGKNFCGSGHGVEPGENGMLSALRNNDTVKEVYVYLCGLLRLWVLVSL